MRAGRFGRGGPWCVLGYNGGMRPALLGCIAAALLAAPAARAATPKELPLPAPIASPAPPTFLAVPIRAGIFVGAEVSPYGGPGISGRDGVLDMDKVRRHANDADLGVNVKRNADTAGHDKPAVPAASPTETVPAAGGAGEPHR